MIDNRNIFKSNIRLIEFEPHSFCNRQCWFCPNQLIDRQGPVRFLDRKIYSQILQDLAGIDYSESMCFAAFCEPFSQPSFLEYVAEARGQLPNVSLFTNTNTDYLNTELVYDACDAGIDLIKAQLYFDRDEEYTDDAIRTKFVKLQAKLPGIKFEEKEKNKWFALVNNRLIIHAYSKDFRKVGHNRCDIAIRPTTKRRHTCMEMVQMIGVNHNGWVVPCCNIRSDYPPHQPVLLGKMDYQAGTIFNLYQGKILHETLYPCCDCMGKQGHANHKLVFNEILQEMRKCENGE